MVEDPHSAPRPAGQAVPGSAAQAPPRRAAPRAGRAMRRARPKRSDQFAGGRTEISRKAEMVDAHTALHHARAICAMSAQHSINTDMAWAVAALAFIQTPPEWKGCAARQRRVTAIGPGQDSSQTCSANMKPIRPASGIEPSPLSFDVCASSELRNNGMPIPPDSCTSTCMSP